MMDTKELDKLNRDLKKIGEKLYKTAVETPDTITRELALGATDIRNTIVMSMRNTPKTGRWYKRGKKKHRASSPGNPPAIDRGKLVRSIMFNVRDMEVEIGAIGGAPYAESLEFGTKKMEPRPFLDPAVKKHAPEIVEIVGQKVFEVIKKPFEGK